MHSKRLLDLFVIGLSALSVAEATFNNRRVDVRDVKAIEQRQGGTEVDEPPAAATDSKSDTPTPSAPPTSTPPPKEPSSTPPTPSAKPSSTPPPVPSTPSTTPQVPSQTQKPPVESPSTQQPPKETTTDAPPPPPESSREIKTVTHRTTITNEDGTQSTLTSESLTTATPGLAGGSNGGSSGGGSGMSTQTRNTVIGVVVGVGGAIILIGLGFVAWRIWGRKKNQDEQDGLMDYTSPNDGKSEVGGSMSGRTPFQSTLESYHAPTHVNQAANF